MKLTLISKALGSGLMDVATGVSESPDEYFVKGEWHGAQIVLAYNKADTTCSRVVSAPWMR